MSMDKEYKFVRIVQDDGIFVALPDKSGMMPCLTEEERKSFMEDAHATFDGTEQGEELVDYLQKLMAAMEKFLEYDDNVQS
jgi:hypothetical protein